MSKNRRNTRRGRAKQKTRWIEPALHRPERFEIERRADAYVIATERQHRINRIVATGLLGTCAAGLVAALLAVLGVF